MAFLPPLPGNKTSGSAVAAGEANAADGDASAVVLPQKAVYSHPSSTVSPLSADEVSQLTQELEVLKEQPRAQMVSLLHTQLAPSVKLD